MSVGTRARVEMHPATPAVVLDATRRSVESYNRGAAVAAEAAWRNSGQGIRSSVVARQMAARIRATPSVAMDERAVARVLQHEELARALGVPCSMLFALRAVDPATAAADDASVVVEQRSAVPVFIADLRTSAAASVVRDGWGVSKAHAANEPPAPQRVPLSIAILLTPAGAADEPSVVRQFAAATTLPSSPLILTASDVASGVSHALQTGIDMLDVQRSVAAPAAEAGGDPDAAPTPRLCSTEEWLQSASDDPTVWPLDSAATRVFCAAVRAFQSHQRRGPDSLAAAREPEEDPETFLHDAAALLQHFAHPDEWVQFARTLPGGPGLGDAAHRATFFRLRGLFAADERARGRT